MVQLVQQWAAQESSGRSVHVVGCVRGNPEQSVLMPVVAPPTSGESDEKWLSHVKYSEKKKKSLTEVPSCFGI